VRRSRRQSCFTPRHTTGAPYPRSFRGARCHPRSDAWQSQKSIPRSYRGIDVKSESPLPRTWSMAPTTEPNCWSKHLGWCDGRVLQVRGSQYLQGQDGASRVALLLVVPRALRIHALFEVRLGFQLQGLGLWFRLQGSGLYAACGDWVIQVRISNTYRAHPWRASSPDPCLNLKPCRVALLLVVPLTLRIHPLFEVRAATPDPTRGNRKSQFHEVTGELASKVHPHYLSRGQWLQLPNPTAGRRIQGGVTTGAIKCEDYNTYRAKMAPAELLYSSSYHGRSVSTLFSRCV